MKKLYYILIIIFISLLYSCGGNGSNSQETGVQTPNNQKKVEQYSKKENNQKNISDKSNNNENKKEKSLEIKETFNYKSLGKRDPFESPISKSKLNQPQTSAQGGIEFNYSRFSYKGIIELTSEKIALIEDSSGKGFRLKKGDSFGGAVVEEITKDRVILKKIQKEAGGTSKKIILEKTESKGGK
ncbi:MAG: pilus assembly protein PilP [Candidatus Mcinerneyibacterium aminivorans]|jgi:type II secretory pathway component PulC|uniref:Pilus assembly protein PilP n=1 Tax=Candidatus Mcinerneyibacterium aminivorans TaxID=2703815 RepID=A0A5D0MEG1_9BACT|nr:MAG: pilus assembly protein PilP [Candidatus Mcinerneyibacterium aminivorans]